MLCHAANKIYLLIWTAWRTKHQPVEMLVADSEVDSEIEVVDVAAAEEVEDVGAEVAVDAEEKMKKNP